MNSNKKNILTSIFTLLVSQVLVKVVGLIYKLYLTNRDGFGDTGNAIYSSGFQIYALLLTFSSTGIPNAISKLVAERIAIGDNKGAYRIFRISFITFSLIGITGTILLFCGAKFIAENLIQIPEAEYCLVALAPSIFFVTVSAVIKGYFNGQQNFSLTAKAQFFEQIFKTVFTIVFVEFVVAIGNKNTKIMAAAANLATTFATMFSFFYIYKYYKCRKKGIEKQLKNSVNYIPTRVRKTIKEILKVSIPISISSLISSFNKNIDSFTVVRLLKKFLTNEEAKIQYGILSGKIDSLCGLAVSLNTAFVTVLVPNISKLIAKKDKKQATNIAKRFVFISLTISIPISIIMFLFPEEIFKILFPNSIKGANYLRASSISIIFIGLCQTENGILQAIGKTNIPAISFSVGIIFKLVCNILLIPNENIGIFGAIIGNIICNLVACIISMIVLIIELKKIKNENYEKKINTEKT